MTSADYQFKAYHVFYNYYRSEKQYMYYDYRFYSPIQAPQMLSRPSMIQPSQLFQVISMALDRNLKLYSQKKANMILLNQEKPSESLRQAKKFETIVIDVSSDQESGSEKIVVQKNQKHLEIHESNQPIILEVEPKQTNSKCKQSDGFLLTSAELSKEQHLKQKVEIQDASIFIKLNKKSDDDFQFVDFSIECPKMGMCNADVLKKKQSLLRRRVADWAQVPQKGPKQRREIRMLGH